MSRTSIDASMSIIDLPAVLTHLFKKAQRPLLLGTEGSCKFSVRYLRRKPKRNLVVVYSVDEMRSSHKTSSNYPNPGSEAFFPVGITRVRKWYNAQGVKLFSQLA